MTTMYGRDELVVPNDELVAAPFIADHGQKLDTDGDPVTGLRYYSESTYPNVYLFDDKISYVFAHIDEDTTTTDTMTRVDMSFYVPGGRTSTVDGLDRQEAFHNYYLGHIPEGRERVPLQNKVLAAGLYPNIDAIYGQGDAGMYIHLICKPGSTPSSIKMEFSGATSVSVQGDGSLLVQTALEDLVLPAMTATTISSGGTETATAWNPTYSIGGDGKVSISLGSYDTDKTLVIKSGRGREVEASCGYWSTYFGDTEDDVTLGSDVDDKMNMYFTGKTLSEHFPATPGAVQFNFKGPADAYAACFKQPDVQVWTTFYGGSTNEGSDLDVGYAIKWNAINNAVYFVGRTGSSNFPLLPVSPGYNNSTAYYSDNFTRGFIVKLNSIDGTSNWATFFGDEHCKRDGAISLEVLQNGNIAVGGYSYAKDSGLSFAFPTTASPSQHSQTAGDAYLAEFSSSNELLWATRLGNNIQQPQPNVPINAITDIAEDLSTNSLLITGTLDGDDSGDYIPFGTSTNTYTYKGGREGFIMRFDGSRSLLWSTYFGGTNFEEPNSIVVLNNGDFVITGSTNSTENDQFPVKAYGSSTNDKINDLSYNGGSRDVFIAKFESNNSLKWCRYLGGPGTDNQGIFFRSETLVTFTGSGNGTTAEGNIIYLTGIAQYGFSPLLGAACQHFHNVINGFSTIMDPGYYSSGEDAFLTVIDEQNAITFNTFWGGSGGTTPNDYGFTVSTGNNGSKPFVLFGGSTNSGGNLPNKTIPVCHESPQQPYYFHANRLLNSPIVHDGFISKIYIESCLIVSTEEKQKNISLLQLYPNPATSFVDILSDQNDERPKHISILDASGRDCTVLISFEEGKALNESFDIHRLPPGLYFIRVYYQNRLAIGKFIKI